jgi:hypothetical protein
MTRKPMARSADLVIEEIDDELLVYDGEKKRAHCLSATAARVWHACDGQTNVEALADRLDLTKDVVIQAVEELEGSALLQTEELQVLNGGAANGNGITRRESLKQSAKVGTAVAAVPLLYSVAVPSPAAAASVTPLQCLLYTTGDCGAGTSSTGCGSIDTCCCCCQKSANLPPSCKVCSSISFCNTTPSSVTCPDNTPGSCSDAKGTNPPANNGCCVYYPNQSTLCGCVWGDAGTCIAGTGTSFPNCVLSGSGCCATDSTKISPKPCTSTTNCVPCCNGQPINVTKVNPGSPPYACCDGTGGPGTGSCPS